MATQRRQFVGVRLSVEGIRQVKALAEMTGTTSSHIIRLALKHGLAAAAREHGITRLP